jgi:hypothetical protein
MRAGDALDLIEGFRFRGDTAGDEDQRNSLLHTVSGTIDSSPRLVGTGSVGRGPHRKVTYEKASHCTWTELVPRYCGRNFDGAHDVERPNCRKNLRSL